MLYISIITIITLAILITKPRLSVYNSTTDEVLYTDFEDGKEFAVFDRRVDAIKSAIRDRYSFGDSVEVTFGKLRLIEAV